MVDGSAVGVTGRSLDDEYCGGITERLKKNYFIARPGDANLPTRRGLKGNVLHLIESNHESKIHGPLPMAGEQTKRAVCPHVAAHD
jgi:hypothetical protein